MKIIDRWAWTLVSLLVIGLYGCQSAPLPSPKPAKDTLPDRVLFIDYVWAGHPVGFVILTHEDHQFVAYYDRDRYLKVAARTLPSAHWTTVTLPARLGWDSHNYATMAVSDDGHLHVAANMHVDPLAYFRTTRPLDVSSLEKVDQMVGTEESMVTYPTFLQGPEGELLFMYRHGYSGNGERYLNVYDPDSQTWRRWGDQPLLSGMGLMNAYPVGPVRGPDGWYHLVWVWRLSPDARTNMVLSYARSRDLEHWAKSTGEPISLPLTIYNAERVDPIPPGAGLLNGNIKIGFDTHGRPVISYHKYDADGNTQIYNARKEGQGWRIYQVSRWNQRWEFGGRGTLEVRVSMGAVQVREGGMLCQPYRHWIRGSGIWRLDEASLQQTGACPSAPSSADPAHALRQPRRPGMQVHLLHSTGSQGDGATYWLRWETLPSNHDQPRDDVPKPSPLELYRLPARQPDPGHSTFSCLFGGAAPSMSPFSFPPRLAHESFPQPLRIEYESWKEGATVSLPQPALDFHDTVKSGERNFAGSCLSFQPRPTLVFFRLSMVNDRPLLG